MSLITTQASPASSPINHPAGFTLLEVLIAIVVLALGLLGLAGLQARMQVSETESYQRSQAILLAEDMANRLSANRLNAASYITGVSSPLGTGNQTQANDCSNLASIAQTDLCEWGNELFGTAEKTGSSTVGAMADARGCVELISTNPDVYRISVAWQGMSELSAPPLLCGQNLYGADSYRRAIASLVTIPCLTCP